VRSLFKILIEVCGTLFALQSLAGISQHVWSLPQGWGFSFAEIAAPSAGIIAESLVPAGLKPRPSQFVGEKFKPAAAAPQAEIIPVALRSLAAGAAKPSAWPRLRRYAETQKGSEQGGLAYFVLGYREYEAEEYPQAERDLSESAVSHMFLADFATYYSAASARKANDPGRAVEIVHNFSSDFPESPLRVQALELLAESLIDSQRGQEAVRILTAEPSARQHASLSLLLAKAYEATGDLPQAARAYEQVYFSFPASSQATEAGVAIGSLGPRLGADFSLPTDEMETSRATLLFNASLYGEALADYEALISSRPSSALMDIWKLGRARCLLHLRRDQEALDALSAGFASPASNAERLALLTQAYARKDDSAAALQALSQIQAINTHFASYETALYSVGNLLFRLRDWQNAGRQYQTLVESFPESKHVQDASWRLIWCHYLGGDHDQARQGLNDYLAHYPQSPHIPSALYWLGRLEEERGEAGEARAVYSLLRSRFAHSFYAEQASLRERQLAAGRAAEAPQPGSLAAGAAQEIPPRQQSPIPSCASEVAAESLRPVLALQELGLEGLAEQYLKTALAARPALPELRFYLSRLEAGQGQASAALFDAAKAVPDYSWYEFSELPKEMWILLYPQSYWRLVQRQARANRIDPFLAMGLIRQESAFNPHAASSADARGLMQILPKTASRSKRPSSIRSTGRRLYNPSYNIRFGCSYLRTLLKEFDSKPELALAAYNAGDFRVRDWLKGNSFRDPSEFLEAIPIPATRAYVESVLRDAAVYRQLLTGSVRFAVCSR
jgi:soluble lytic murein transglycosylase